MVSYPNSIPAGATAQGNLTVKGTLKVTPGAVVEVGTTNLYDSGGNLQTDDYFVMPNGQSSGDFTAFGGDAKSLAAGTVGGGLAIKEGSNARSGRLVLNGTTPVVVSNTSVTALTEVQLTHNIPGGTPDFCFVSARTPGVSFSVTGRAGDTSTVAYLLVEPY